MNSLRYCFAVAILFSSWNPTMAQMETATVIYKDGDQVFEGYVAWDNSVSWEGRVAEGEGVSEGGSDDAENGAKPGILVVHQWMGLTDYEKRRCRELAELGYVAFALDVYGQGVRPKNASEAGAQAGKFKHDRNLFRKRLVLGLEQLQEHAACDPQRIAAIGYCFGGTGVLELARSGAEIEGVVSFHGGLDSPRPEDGKMIKSKVLICHGADDPFVPQDEIDAMIKEFNDANVDWQMISYSHAVHAFTQSMAGNDNSRGAAYNAVADHRSWAAMKSFFQELFESK